MATEGTFDRVIHFNDHNHETIGGFALSVLVQLIEPRGWMKGRGNGK
jgi:hypothetical protein